MIGHHHAVLASCLIENAGEAFLIFNLENLRVLDINSAAQLLSGYCKNQPLEMRLPDLIETTSERGSEQRTSSSHSEDSSDSRGSCHLRCHEDYILPISINLSRIPTQPEHLELVTVRDISEMKTADSTPWSLVRGTSTLVRTDYFSSLVQNIAQSFEICYAQIAQYLKPPVSPVRTLAFQAADRLIKNVEDAVNVTPCKETVAGTTTFLRMKCKLHIHHLLRPSLMAHEWG